MLVPSFWPHASPSPHTAHTHFDGHGYHGDTLISGHDIMFSQACVTIPKQAHHPVTLIFCSLYTNLFFFLHTQHTQISLKGLGFQGSCAAVLLRKVLRSLYVSR